MRRKQCYQRGSLKEDKTTGRITIRWIVRNPIAKTGWKHRSLTLPPGITKKKAQSILDQKTREANAQNNDPRAMVQTVTFADFYKGIWQTYMQNKGVRDSTQYSYDAMWKHYLAPALGHKLINEIGPQDLSRLFSDLQDIMSPKYRLNLYSLLNTMFEVARAHDLIESMPLKRKLHRPAYHRKEKPVLSSAQIVATIREIPDEHKPLVFLIAVTGLRLGEALGLQWQDIDFAACRLRVVRSLWRRSLTQPKTQASIRSLIIPSELVDALRLQLSRSEFRAPGDFVFCRSDGSALDPDSLRREVLYPAMDRADIKRTDREYGFHIFRHTAGSIVHTATGNLRLIRDFLGHARISTTSDIYVHTDSEDASAEATKILAELFFAESLRKDDGRVN